MYGVLDWLLSLAALILMVAFAFGASTMASILERCLRLARWLDPRSGHSHRHRQTAELRGVALFFFLLVGVPVLIVVWGYATGRLPAASPYLD